MSDKASNPPQNRLAQMLGLLLLRISLGSALNLRRVMSRKPRERLPKNQHGEETEGILW